MEPADPRNDRLADCFEKPVWTLTALSRELPEIPRHLRRLLPTLVGRPIDARLR